jgi:Putative auto-transporter adhesin, head GIN domain
MKQIMYAAAIAVFFLSSCYFHSETGSGNITTESRTVSEFTGIEASASVEVEVKTGSPKVAVEADDNILRLVETHVSGGTLHIGIKNGSSINNAHVKIYVTVPVLNHIEANSSASIKVTDMIKSDRRIRLEASSSANIEAGIDAPEIEAEANSSGSINLSGQTRIYKAEASSAGNVKSFELLTETADVSTSSAGRIEVHASVKLKADASSGGNIEYRGGAEVKSETNSGGSIYKKDN